MNGYDPPVSVKSICHSRWIGNMSMIMTDNVENLILEMLKVLRNEVESQSVKMDEQFESVRLRLGSIESHLAGLQREVARIHADIAIVHGRMAIGG